MQKSINTHTDTHISPLSWNGRRWWTCSLSCQILKCWAQQVQVCVQLCNMDMGLQVARLQVCERKWMKHLGQNSPKNTGHILLLQTNQSVSAHTHTHTYTKVPVTIPHQIFFISIYFLKSPLFLMHHSTSQFCRVIIRHHSFRLWSSHLTLRTILSGDSNFWDDCQFWGFSVFDMGDIDYCRGWHHGGGNIKHSAKNINKLPACQHIGFLLPVLWEVSVPSSLNCLPYRREGAGWFSAIF